MKLKRVSSTFVIVSALWLMTMPVVGSSADARLPSAEARVQTEMTLQLVGYLGGESRAVFVQGNPSASSGQVYAYAALGQELAVLNIVNPAQPTRVGSLVLSDAIYQVQVVGNYAYLLGERNTAAHLWVVNVSNPVQPTQVAKYDLARGIAHGEQTNALYISGNYGYVVSQGNVFSGLRIINLSNPSAPTQVGTLKTNPFRAQRIFVAGQYAYLTGDEGLANTNRLRVVDVSQPNAPQVVGSLSLAGWIMGLHVSGNYAYLADANLRVVNISNPANPTLFGSFDASGTASSVVVSGNYAYLGGSGLRVLNIANPANPTQVGSTLTTWSTSDVAVSGSYAYLAGSYAGLRVVDVSNPANPSQVGSALLNSDSGSIAVSGNYAFVIAGNELRVLDISNPSTPVELFTFTTPLWPVDVHASGEYVYVTGNGMFILRLVPLALQAAPTSLVFMAQVGGANPAPRSVSITSNGRALNWTAGENPAVGWLNIAPSSGTTSSSVTVTPNIAGLGIGQYQTQLVVQANDPVQGSPQTIPITLLVVQTLNNLYLPLVLR